MADIEFTVKGDIPSLKNSLQVGRGGRFFHKNDKVRQYKNAFWAQTPSKYRTKGTAHPLIVELRLYKKDNRKDGCNLGAIVYDSLQSSGVIKNDRQIIERHEYDAIDKNNPRVKVSIWEIRDDV